MENNSLSRCNNQQLFLHHLETLWPIARGSVSEVRKPCVRKGCKACASGQKHAAHIYTYREDGKLHCRHVRPEFVGELKRAIENGRALDRLLARLGPELLKNMRTPRT